MQNKTAEDIMRLALKEAEKALLCNEVPIGAVLTDSKTNKVIAKAHNLSEAKNCLCHAEILVIEKACKKLKQNRLRDMDLYVTLEPCTMCAAAISFARIKNLFFGAYDEKGGGITSGAKFFEQQTCHHKPNITGGVLKDDCSKIIKDFFKQKRDSK